MARAIGKLYPVEQTPSGIDPSAVVDKGARIGAGVFIGPHASVGEAAIIGQYVSKTAPKEETQLAVDSAYLAMAAFAQAFNEAHGPVEARTADLQFVINACEFLLARWPSDPRANDARMS